MVDALAGKFNDHPVWPAFHETVQRFKIPHEYFHHMIDGGFERPDGAQYRDV